MDDDITDVRASFRAILDDALDDLPRYMAVVQPPDGWLPGDGEGPTVFACVSVDNVRAMIRTAGRGQNASAR